jgi:hypothetical protein
MEILKKSLRNTVRENVGSDKEFIWIGVIEHKRAKKYKYEIFWLKTEDLWMEEEGVDLAHISFGFNHFDNCETRICETIKEAYAYGFNEIKESLEEDPNCVIKIIDLVTTENED